MGVNPTPKAMMRKLRMLIIIEDKGHLQGKYQLQISNDGKGSQNNNQKRRSHS